MVLIFHPRVGARTVFYTRSLISMRLLFVRQIARAEMLIGTGVHIPNL